jgi:hypothetical protein
MTSLEVSQLAANVATTVGIIGVFIAYRQFRAGAEGQRQATAIATWQNYLQLALQHPDLSLPSAHLSGAGEGSEEHSRYRWFVSTMLFAGEQVLDAHPGDSARETTVKAQLTLHRRHLSRDGFRKGFYSHRITQLIEKVQTETRALASDSSK